MMPERARIKTVDIYYGDGVRGFRFFDRYFRLIFEIGYIESWLNVKTVVLADNEVIIGVAAKL